MRTYQTLVIFAFLASIFAVGPTIANADQTNLSAMAPADEYFGRFKMSILGIRNELRDLNARLSYTPDSGADVLGTAELVENAMRDWERKYPADPWLAKSVYELTALYERVHTSEGFEDAHRAMRWLLNRYGASQYADMARSQFGANFGSQ